MRRGGEGGGSGAAAAAERIEGRGMVRSLKGNGETGVSKGRKGRVGGWPPTAKKTKIATTTNFFLPFSQKRNITNNI